MRVLWPLAVVICLALAERFDEELVVSRLPSGSFLSQFRFRIASDSLELGNEYELFPRVLAELISHHSVKALSLSLGQGRWFPEEWALPTQPSAPTGAYIHAWIDGNDTEVDERWQRVINSLNGIVCTSLTTIVPQLSSSPRLLSTVSAGEQGGQFRYGALAKESVCTENLTPWKKLLPCKQNGLTSLLNPPKLYGGWYHSMALHLAPSCSQGACHWRLELLLNLVSPLLSTRHNDVDLETIFGRKVVGVCEAADTSSIFVAAENSADGFVKHDMKKEDAPKNPQVNLQKEETYLEKTPIVSVSSKIGGIGDYAGKIVTTMTNSASARRVIFTHSIPWFVKIHYHTLTLRCETNSGQSLKPEIFSRNFVPAISRKSPAVIEYDFEFPTNSRCFVEFAFKKAFLRLREYPPDANHGMYVPSAIVNILETHDLTTPGGAIGLRKDEKTPMSVHGNVLLIVLPVPDFSMPFNVICFVLTTISLCFGPIHNFSTKMLIPLNTPLPMAPTYRKILRAFMLVLLCFALYAQYHEIGLNEVRRLIARAVEDVKEGMEKMNSL